MKDSSSRLSFHSFSKDYFRSCICQFPKSHIQNFISLSGLFQIFNTCIEIFALVNVFSNLGLKYLYYHIYLCVLVCTQLGFSFMSKCCPQITHYCYVNTTMYVLTQYNSQIMLTHSCVVFCHDF
jgi:hypothetical protein